MKHDIVYILGDGSKWQNNELRYSLRSLERYFEHGSVFIVGECPNWLRNITHINVSDKFPGSAEGKMKNAVRKIRAACEDERISESFVLMNDDFYFLRPCPKIEPFSLGTIQEMLDSHRSKTGYYYNALRGTMHFLERQGIENPVGYAAHYPIVHEKQKFLQMTNAIDWLGIAYSWRTIYGNLFRIGNIEREDTKVSSLSDFEEFLAREEHEDFLSSSGGVVLYPEFQDWIGKKFPSQSKYEKEIVIRRLKTAKDIWDSAALKSSKTP